MSNYKAKPKSDRRSGNREQQVKTEQHSQATKTDIDKKRSSPARNNVQKRDFKSPQENSKNVDDLKRDELERDDSMGEDSGAMPGNKTRGQKGGSDSA